MSEHDVAHTDGDAWEVVLALGFEGGTFTIARSTQREPPVFVTRLDQALLVEMVEDQGTLSGRARGWSGSGSRASRAWRG